MGTSRLASVQSAQGQATPLELVDLNVQGGQLAGPLAGEHLRSRLALQGLRLGIGDGQA